MSDGCSNTTMHSMTVCRDRGQRRHTKQGECANSGRRHSTRVKSNCPTFGKTCRKCHRLNHFSAKCRNETKHSRTVRAVDEEEVFTVSEVAKIDVSQVLTLKLESVNYLRFQLDSGVQCNVIPLALYEKATRDFDQCNVIPLALYEKATRDFDQCNVIPLALYAKGTRDFDQCNVIPLALYEKATTDFDQCSVTPARSTILRMVATNYQSSAWSGFESGAATTTAFSVASW